MKDLFEGVYLKHQKNGESICFIAGRAGETRFVQVITNGTVRQYDGAQGFCFGEEGVAAELPGVQGALLSAEAVQPRRIQHGAHAGGRVHGGRSIHRPDGRDRIH